MNNPNMQVTPPANALGADIDDTMLTRLAMMGPPPPVPMQQPLQAPGQELMPQGIMAAFDAIKRNTMASTPMAQPGAMKPPMTRGEAATNHMGGSMGVGGAIMGGGY